MEYPAFSVVDETTILNYEANGVVCLRGMIHPRWVDLAREGVQRNLKYPGKFFRDHTPEGSRGRYVFDFWTWPDIPEFRKIIFDSPLAGVAGELMRSQYINLVMDNWFMREAGATNAAPWHHDEPYFDFEGRLCIVWVPLEPMNRSEGLTFVKGSHRWGQLFVAPQFSENVPFVCEGDRYKPMPDIDSVPNRHEFLSWDVELGDCLVFDFRTIHSITSKSETACSTHHRLSLRFGSHDVQFNPRGPWTKETTDYLISLGQRPSKPINCPLLPKVWESNSR